MNAQVLDELKKDMEHTLDALRKELAKVRTGRASTTFIEGVMVEYYGTRTPLNQLAALSAYGEHIGLVLVERFGAAQIVEPFGHIARLLTQLP